MLKITGLRFRKNQLNQAFPQLNGRVSTSKLDSSLSLYDSFDYISIFVIEKDKLVLKTLLSLL